MPDFAWMWAILSPLPAITEDWLPALEPWLGQLHLHDNHGDRNSHLAIGEGLFDYLNQKDMTPIITLEPHYEEAFWGSIKALERLFF